MRVVAYMEVGKGREHGAEALPKAPTVGAPRPEQKSEYANSCISRGIGYRTSLDAEFQRLLAETTSFNGRNGIGYMNTVTDVSDPVANPVVDNLSIDNAGEFDIDGTAVAATADNANGRGHGSALSIAAAINASGGTDMINATTINAGSILTEADSDLPANRNDVALRQIDSLRGIFGAIQSRFGSTIANLQTMIENISASRARIRDADFAAETANLAHAQILQQAGISILTQANAQPQLVLSLLHNDFEL